MSEVLLPPWIVPEVETHEWLDEGSSVFRAAFAPGIAQRQSYGGLRLKLSRRHTVRGEEKAQLLSVLKQTRGAYNVLRTKVHFALRGAHSKSELLTNNTFANGTTGWTNGSEYTISAIDRAIVAVRNAVTAGATLLTNSTAATVTQYAPHVFRAYVAEGRGAYPSLNIGMGATSGSSGFGVTLNNPFGLLKQAGVPTGTSAHGTLADNASSARIAGDYVTVLYVSLIPCPVVDNGLNSLLQSDEFDTTWTATRASVDDQTGGTNAPDGTSTADSIIEDATASNTHFVSQSVVVSAASGDYSLNVALKAGTRTWAIVRIFDDTAVASIGVAYFNLSTGAVGTTAVGGSGSNVRAFVVSLGNDWYSCCVVARKTTSATSISARIGLATGDGAESYTGDGASNIYAWRATLVQSGVPTRLINTTTTASTGTSQTGNSLYVKGLPASTNGLLLPSDWFEINGELKQATAALNSDAAGLGYLQFEPALVRSPANDDPVIVTDPMGKFLVSNIKIENEFGTQAKVSYDLEHIYE